MLISTANNYVDIAISQLDSEFRSALFYHPALAELCNQFNTIITGQPFYTSLPQWAKTRLWTHRKYLLERINRDYVIQLYCLPDGRRTIPKGSWDSFGEELRQHVRDGGEVLIKTFWLSVKESCDQEGIVTRVSTPTEDVFF
jgi:hypothetical protein|tara:strand:+ start:35 stop:460 length:426 start_codon:yes stop_codon:yes gene_type:complete